MFTTSTGRHLEPRNLNTAFGRLIARAGVRPIRFQDLRHTCATLLLGRGASPRVVMDILGHSQIAVIMNIYAHVIPAMHLGQPQVVTAAYAAAVRAQVAILATLHTQIKAMQKQVEAHFGQHPDAELYLSQPGLGPVLGARVLAEFGYDKTRYADAKARRNYAGTSPITRQSGRKKIVLARYVHNDRLIDALGRQAFAALIASPGARGYYDQQRARGISHHAALRELGNRLVGILHGCLKTRTTYDEATAWPHHQEHDQTAAA